MRAELLLKARDLADERQNRRLALSRSATSASCCSQRMTGCGSPHQQAAKQLRLSIPAMKSRVQRGRRQLRKLFHDCCVIELDNRGGVTDFEMRRPGPGC